MNASSEDRRKTDAAPPDVPREGRLLGLDYGTKRIGVALSTPEQNLASPLANYTRSGPAADARYLQRVAEEYHVVALVVGLPVHMSGDEGGKAAEAREFGAWASSATRLPVTYWDERFTTAVAEEALLAAGLSKQKRKRRLDMLAAQIMLQSFLDRRASSDR